jgi:hypothetical protein
MANTHDDIAADDAFRSRLRELCSEDDFAGGLNVLEQYPEFERDVRDWGFVYGLAFGLALAEWPDASHPEVAQRAFTSALSVYRGWGGDIEDPGVKRENAIRGVVQRFNEADRHRLHEGYPIDGKLLGALEELDDAARG